MVSAIGASSWAQISSVRQPLGNQAAIPVEPVRSNVVFPIPPVAPIRGQSYSGYGSSGYASNGDQSGRAVDRRV
jgi:hypothetical protein